MIMQEMTIKIANLLLSEEQANKDLAFSLIESLGVDFGEVCEEIRKALILKCDTIERLEFFKTELLGHKILIEGHKYSQHVLVQVLYWKTEPAYFKIKPKASRWNIAPHWRTLTNNLSSSIKENNTSFIDCIDLLIPRLIQKYNETKQSNNNKRPR